MQNFHLGKRERAIGTARQCAGSADRDDIRMLEGTRVARLAIDNVFLTAPGLELAAYLSGVNFCRYESVHS